MFLTMAIDHWGDCCILVPWAEYRARGNLELLRRMYPVMKRYIWACEWWAERNPGKKGLWKHGFHYGDWCAQDTNFSGWKKRGRFTATAMLSYSCGILSEIARLLGKEKDADDYEKLSERSADAYRKYLLTPDGRVRWKEEFMSAYVLPLYYGLLKGDLRKEVAKRLADLVRKNEYHVTTGFPGTPYILFALMDNGYEKEAYRMLENDTCPSWLYEIKAGGTTLWERWDALREDGTINQGDGGSMVSFNHYAAGSVGDFLYRRIAGTEPLSGGYQSFRIAPKPGGTLTQASAYTDTAYGRVESAWRIEDGIFFLKVTIPFGTECEVTLPGGSTKRLGSGSYTFEEAYKG